MDEKKLLTRLITSETELIQIIINIINKTQSYVIIITPTGIPAILETLQQVAYKKKATRFFYTSKWNLKSFGGTIDQLKQLGNIQFRDMKANVEFYAISRDTEEIVLAPAVKDPSEFNALVSTQEGFVILYSNFIGPIFQANSRAL